MKNVSIGILLILLVFVSANSANAKDKGKNDLVIISAIPNFNNSSLSIYGYNFGKNPVVLLEEELLKVEQHTNDHIEALL